LVDVPQCEVMYPGFVRFIDFNLFISRYKRKIIEQLREFKQRSRSVSIVREAVKEGIEI
jgi:hypothetical protein